MLDAYFTRSFYKHILSKTLSVYDMEQIKPIWFTSLKGLLETDLTGVFISNFTYKQEQDDGSFVEIELKEGGRDIALDESNKKEFVKLRCYSEMTKNV